MPCVLQIVTGNSTCRFKGAAGASVTLNVVGTKGRAKFAAAHYDGKDLISAPADEFSFKIKAGQNDLSIAYTFSDPNGRAELHEKCDANTLLDDRITSLNNIKLYGICDGAAIAALAPAAKAAKRATKKRRQGVAGGKA